MMSMMIMTMEMSNLAVPLFQIFWLKLQCLSWSHSHHKLGRKALGVTCTRIDGQQQVSSTTNNMSVDSLAEHQPNHTKLSKQHQTMCCDVLGKLPMTGWWLVSSTTVKPQLLMSGERLDEEWPSWSPTNLSSWSPSNLVDLRPSALLHSVSLWYLGDDWRDNHHK